ncbi:CLUMA_CG011816, isoform A [Clunio marinus]|uniref:CLUMA_CG011816, isoform A n=1 Tax=Clunio marinus TaxID=568069 RepID=A0A1J1IE28_9DIPT|nr:CLUMA_CG011816, isoform A [Clunio marinus]
MEKRLIHNERDGDMREQAIKIRDNNLKESSEEEVVLRRKLENSTTISDFKAIKNKNLFNQITQLESHFVGLLLGLTLEYYDHHLR